MYIQQVHFLNIVLVIGTNSYVSETVLAHVKCVKLDMSSTDRDSFGIQLTHSTTYDVENNEEYQNG